MAFKRDVEISVVRAIYTIYENNRVEYLGQLGSMNIYPLSRDLKQKQNYLTLIEPFDKYIWMFLAVSVLSVTLAIVMIDKCYLSWRNLVTEDVVYHSRITYSQ